MKTLQQKFDEKYIAEPMSGCWLWTASKLQDGYGRLRVGNITEGAHRVSYKLNRGKIPEGLCVLHTCDVSACVNPEHLWLGTVADNNADMMKKGRGVFVKGAKNGSSKLTETQVIEIRASTKNQYVLAEEYRTSQGHISGILSRKSWSHI